MILKSMHRPSSRTQRRDGLHRGLGTSQRADERRTGRHRCGTNASLIGVATLPGWRIDDQGLLKTVRL